MSYLRSRPPPRNTIVSLARRKRQLPRHGAAKAASLWPARRDTASARLAQRFKMTARCWSFARSAPRLGFHSPRQRKIFALTFVGLHDLGQFAALFGAVSKPAGSGFDAGTKSQFFGSPEQDNQARRGVAGEPDLTGQGCHPRASRAIIGSCDRAPNNCGAQDSVLVSTAGRQRSGACRSSSPNIRTLLI